MPDECRSQRGTLTGVGPWLCQTSENAVQEKFAEFQTSTTHFYPVPHSKRTSRAPSPSTVRNRSSHSFVNRELHRDAIEAEEVSVLGDHLARQLHGGLLF